MKGLLIIYSITTVILSLIAFILFGNDKARAKKGGIRIKERTLLLVSALGGGIGGLVGSLFFRHKTKKIYFDIVLTLSTIFEIVTFIYILYILNGGLM